MSSTGAENQFQVDDNGHVGRPCEVSLAPPYPELFTSYGDSAVTRTSGRGHVAEAKTNVIEVGGFRERESVCCLLVLNLVSSTLSCIRQPRPRLPQCHGPQRAALSGLWAIPSTESGPQPLPSSVHWWVRGEQARRPCAASMREDGHT